MINKVFILLVTGFLLIISACSSDPEPSVNEDCLQLPGMPLPGTCPKPT